MSVLIGISACAPAFEINGIPIPNATSTFEATQEVTEFREDGNPVIRLISGPKRYTVCAVARAPIAVLDAEVPVADVSNYFVVKVEDGRDLSNCLMESLKTEAQEKTQNSPTVYVARMPRCRSGRKEVVTQRDDGPYYSGCTKTAHWLSRSHPRHPQRPQSPGWLCRSRGRP